MALLKVRSTQRKRIGGPFAPDLQDNRFDGINHISISTTQGRCTVCQRNTRTRCNKCEKCLHNIICFDKYHTLNILVLCFYNKYFVKIPINMHSCNVVIVSSCITVIIFSAMFLSDVIFIIFSAMMMPTLPI